MRVQQRWVLLAGNEYCRKYNIWLALKELGRFHGSAKGGENQGGDGESPGGK